MKLGEIKDYVRQRGNSSLNDVALHFDISNEAAQLALQYWVKKGKIMEQGAACGSSCGGCGDGDENYQWVESEKTIQWL